MRLLQTSIRTVIIGSVILSVTVSMANDLLKPVANKSHLRRPVAIEFDQSEKVLVVANRDSGSISLIDVQTQTLQGEFQLGKRLTDIAFLKRANCFLVTDGGNNKLYCFRISEEEDGLRPQLFWERATIASPGSLAVSDDELTVAVAGLWSRQIEIIQINDPSNHQPSSGTTIDLKFCPGPMVWIDQQKLLTADAFGDRFAIVTSNANSTINFQVENHRTGGVAFSADGKWIGFSDQRLNPLAHSSRNDVHWGQMIFNQMRWLPVEKLRSAKADSDLDDLSREFVNQPVGRPEDAKADLGEFAVAKNGTVMITIGGVNELAVGQRADDALAFVPVGTRPIAVVAPLSGEKCFVANQLDDTISVVDLDELEVTKTISLGDSPELNLAQQGEVLFFDARLSHDGWMSCHSCHVEGHANGMLNDNFSDKSFNTPKRVISLLGHKETLPLGWLGTQSSFESQVRASIEVTMQSDEPPSDEQVNAIAEFVRTLPAPDSVSMARGRIDPQELARGKELFTSLDCSRCHSPPTYTTMDTYDVGIRDEKGKTRFNPPSLIGLGQQDHFFHDGRHNSLQDLFAKSEHQLPRNLTDQEMSDLIVFLKSL